MRIVKLYKDYITSPECVISDLFTKLENDVESWFESSDKGNSVTTSKTIGTGLICVMHIDIEADTENYSFEISVNIEDMENPSEVTKATFVSKKYDMDANLVNSSTEDVNPSAITEEYLLNKISELDSNQKGETAEVTPELPVQKGNVNDDGDKGVGPKDDAPPSEMFTV